MPADPHPYVVVTAVIASLGALISTAEWLHGRQQLADRGLFSWQVVGARPLTLGPNFTALALNRLLAFRPFVAILVLRLLVLAVLPVAVWTGTGMVAALAIILATSFLMHLRSPFGMDGSDQMNLQIFGALFLGYLGGSLLALQAALWFIGAQSCLSYLTSGVAKALSPHWRAGHVVFGIFNTRTYGYEPVARFLLHRPALERTLCWGAVVMECSFVLAVVAGFPGCLIFLAWGFAFHAMNALVMGLNSFLWSFVATYPAVIYCSLVISQLCCGSISRHG
jgi:hypothetical protein